MTIIVLIEVQLKQKQSFINIMSVFASKCVCVCVGGGILNGAFIIRYFTICT